MLPWETEVKAAAALLTATFALLVLAGGPRRPAHQFLAFFLLLIAGNQGAEAIRTLAVQMVDEAAARAWFRVATVFAALDPWVLYYFASVYPRPNLLNRGLAVGAVAAASAAFVARAVAGQAPWPPGSAEDVGLALFTGVAYAALLAHAARLLVENANDPARRLLLIAVALAAVPVWSRVGIALADAYDPANPSLGGLGFAFAAVVALATVLRAPPLARRAALHAALAGLALASLLNGGKLLLALGIGFPANALPSVALNLLSSLSAPIRWLIFGLLVSMALLRHDLLGMSITARRRAARVLVSLTFLGGALLVLAAAQTLAGGGIAVTPLEVGVLLLALVASQGFRSIVDRVASEVYGVPVPGDVAASLEAYRQAAAQSAAEQRPLAGDARLERLREELALDPRAAAILRRMVEAAPAGPLGPGEVVQGRYRVVRFVGRGGAGRVFLARDELLGADVVLKEMLHGLDGAEAAALREARIAGQLSSPRVVALLDVLERPGATLLVTEWVPGGSLADRVAARGRLAAEEGLALLDGLLEGLEAVHAQGIVHRDLKPANVLLDADGRPKIADFGIALVLAGATAELGRGTVVGTLEFMAPEQRRGEPALPSTDLYAAALVVRRCSEPLPARVEEVLARGLLEHPAERWPSAREMRAALAAAAP